MTMKEAIEYIEALKNSDEILDFYYAEEFIKAFEIAIRALEKQIVKKPIINYINTSEDATEIEYTCSVCGTNFVELTPCKEWCPYCGNKINWSDEE